ncbi:hypothetical protein CEXT_707071 [Caerostris extrusa]|uniref:Uncharacterized protein n=1 Tax=Caerostris extrusa TaxID=172846 RepID=A0AAV4TXZ5_CAEEX|nr:hypothetical protein CEXT_707071 [Caerostris extrusa]
MTTSASLIAEESKKQCSAMPEATGNLTFTQQRFLMVSQTGITLTVWRIVPITRSLILVLLVLRWNARWGAVSQISTIYYGDDCTASPLWHHNL